MAAVPLGLAAAAPKVSPPQPFGALPSARQLAWHDLQFTAFLHFTVNTFTDKEWGYGDEDPSVFDPKQFDADAIISALKAGGMRQVILTCKHHDGFCLWPTKTTEHHVRRGDIVKDLSEAARRQGLKFGVYLSPWDRNNAAYGTPEYIDIYWNQLRELLTQYGPIHEVWHDGANGGDGYYGGAKEKRLIDKRTYYDWPKTWDLVRSLQPDAVIFSDVGPDLRWVGTTNPVLQRPADRWPQFKRRQTGHYARKFLDYNGFKVVADPLAGFKTLGDDDRLGKKVVGELDIERKVKTHGSLADICRPMVNIGVIFQEFLEVFNDRLRRIDRGGLREF